LENAAFVIACNPKKNIFFTPFCGKVDQKISGKSLITPNGSLIAEEISLRVSIGKLCQCIFKVLA
jgi:hypothetical protein